MIKAVATPPMAVRLPITSQPLELGLGLEPAAASTFLLEVMRSIDRANARGGTPQPQPAASEREP